MNILQKIATFNKTNKTIINICEKYMNDNIDNENNDMLSLIIAELIFDDSTYFRFIYKLFILLSLININPRSLQNGFHCSRNYINMKERLIHT